MSSSEVGVRGALSLKITAQHREKRAYVYIRQSDPKQVRHNRGSQYNQYALVEHAVRLGWIPERVHVLDEDLGHSSQEPDRHGFAELVSEVSLGRVGLVLAYEASRLARSNADWYRLLDRISPLWSARSLEMRTAFTIHATITTGSYLAYGGC